MKRNKKTSKDGISKAKTRERKKRERGAFHEKSASTGEKKEVVLQELQEEHGI